jgi:hypothetical protein
MCCFRYLDETGLGQYGHPRVAAEAEAEAEAAVAEVVGARVGGLVEEAVEEAEEEEEEEETIAAVAAAAAAASVAGVVLGLLSLAVMTTAAPVLGRPEDVALAVPLGADPTGTGGSGGSCGTGSPYSRVCTLCATVGQPHMGNANPLIHSLVRHEQRHEQRVVTFTNT